VTIAETPSATTSAEAADSEPREQPYPEPQQSNAEKLAEWAVNSITELRWGVTVNLGDYESARLEATALVSLGQDPSSILALLQTWVSEHSPPTRNQWEDMIAQKHQLEAKLQDLNRQVRWSQEQWDAVRRFLLENNLPLPARVIDDLPF